jgi:hypothetical protein
MNADVRELTDAYISARHQHPAWIILAARRAPLVLSCLHTLFEHSQDGIAFEDALRSLAEILGQHANNSDFEIDGDDYPFKSLEYGDSLAILGLRMATLPPFCNGFEYVRTKRCIHRETLGNHTRNSRRFADLEPAAEIH